MPFQSEKQRRYLHANVPAVAKRWEAEYPKPKVSPREKIVNALMGKKRGLPSPG